MRSIKVGNDSKTSGIIDDPNVTWDLRNMRKNTCFNTESIISTYVFVISRIIDLIDVRMS